MANNNNNNKMENNNETEEDAIVEQFLQIQRRRTHHQSHMIHIALPRFRDNHNTALEIPLNFGLPNHLLSDDHAANRTYQMIRFQRSEAPANQSEYYFSARLCNKNNLNLRYFVTAWCGDEELVSVRNREAMVDAGTWLPLCDFDLNYDHFDELHDIDGDSVSREEEEERDLTIFLNIIVTGETVVRREQIMEEAEGEDNQPLDNEAPLRRQNDRMGIAARWLLWAGAGMLLSMWSE